ncbi:Cytoplasmic axial filament protein CafA and Ribonuclease G [Euzebya pacifica]|uniref:Ribonuclease E n=1 Tax=Euzebya pacifica TaxID=1608957 RepID=A0A346XVJ0_9ACTN|nr:Rne/Rng family ribonuclease [Euzebya pacifica]AXV06237.1 Cytoplasmic axial filament protein CafA and Ribonuclease G [Euzebya pacifica]
MSETEQQDLPDDAGEDRTERTRVRRRTARPIAVDPFAVDTDEESDDDAEDEAEDTTEASSTDTDEAPADESDADESSDDSSDATESTSAASSNSDDNSDSDDNGDSGKGDSDGSGGSRGDASGETGEDKPRRRRRRGRRGRGRGRGGADGQNQTDDDSSDGDSKDGASRDGDSKDGDSRDGDSRDTSTDDGGDAAADGDEQRSGSGKGNRTRTRTRAQQRTAGDDTDREDDEGESAQADSAQAGSAQSDDDDAEGDDRSDKKSDRGGSNRNRSGKGRQGDRSGRGGQQKSDNGKGGSSGQKAKDESDEDDSTRDPSDTNEGKDSGGAKDDDGDDDKGRSGRRRRRGRRGRGRRGRSGGGGGGSANKGDGGSKDDQGAPTRLSARSQRTSGGRRRVPSVSPETRRVMAESPPKRMLVTVGKERTQIAVLEERTLVEHYVTQASEASYVGNIYKGRVQNVLPGMEAAFVDIGKGRNGVLYAGEVNYDEADRDGGLPRIEQALKSGQPVMVQVTKDPMGTKGARLTQHLSLAGRYCVLAPGDDMLGISRKLPDDQRDRLRKILKGLKPEGFGLIVRTAAESATAEQLEADVARLLERWKKVEEKAEKAKPLESIYSEPQLVLRVIRDVFGPEHTQLIIDDAELADEVRSYLSEVSPEHVAKVVTYDPPAQADGGVERLFDAYEVTTQIRRALEKKVWLKSGGYLIIEKTEAMWVIDVNTGKFVGKDNLEETVLRNNIEAAEEIARQLRLRDMGGIIVIDFVDMIVQANREEVLKRFKRELARDKTKSRVMEISKLGLVQMTRKNVSKGLMEAFTEETDDVIPGRRIVEDLLA